VEIIFHITAKVQAAMESADGGIQYVLHGILSFSWTDAANVQCAFPVNKEAFAVHKVGDELIFRLTDKIPADQ
jgi:hypothetical protein